MMMIDDNNKGEKKMQIFDMDFYNNFEAQIQEGTAWKHYHVTGPYREVDGIHYEIDDYGHSVLKMVDDGNGEVWFFYFKF